MFLVKHIAIELTQQINQASSLFTDYDLSLVPWQKHAVSKIHLPITLTLAIPFRSIVVLLRKHL